MCICIMLLWRDNLTKSIENQECNVKFYWLSRNFFYQLSMIITSFIKTFSVTFVWAILYKWIFPSRNLSLKIWNLCYKWKHLVNGRPSYIIHHSINKIKSHLKVALVRRLPLQYGTTCVNENPASTTSWHCSCGRSHT